MERNDMLKTIKNAGITCTSDGLLYEAIRAGDYKRVNDECFNSIVRRQKELEFLKQFILTCHEN